MQIGFFPIGMALSWVAQDAKAITGTIERLAETLVVPAARL